MPEEPYPIPFLTSPLVPLHELSKELLAVLFANPDLMIEMMKREEEINRLKSALEECRQALEGRDE